MSVKKLLIVAAGMACISTTAALAGGSDADTIPAPAFEPNVYLEANFGFASADWTSWTNQNLGPWAASNLGGGPDSNKDGGFVGGFDLGYQFTRNLSVEGGWFHLPTVSGNTNGNGNVTVHNWFGYGAAKLSLPVIDAIDIFGKIGVAYRYVRYGGVNNNVSTPYDGNNGYWTPMFSLGAKYLLTENWSLNLQWLFL